MHRFIGPGRANSNRQEKTVTEPGQQPRKELEDLQPREDESAGLKGGVSQENAHGSGGGKRSDIGPGMDN